MAIDAPVAENESDAPGSAPEPEAQKRRIQCSECEFVASSENGLRVHWAKKHKGQEMPSFTDAPRRTVQEVPQKPAESSKPVPRSPKELEDIRKAFQESLGTLAGFAFAFGLRVTGVAIANRAEPLSYQAMVFGGKSEAVMKGILAFNQVMASGELAKLGGEVALAVGVDTGMLHPAKTAHIGPINVPGFVLLQPIAADIAEVEKIAAQAAQMEQQYKQAQAAAQAAQNGHPGARPNA